MDILRLNIPQALPLTLEQHIQEVCLRGATSAFVDADLELAFLNVEPYRGLTAEESAYGETMACNEAYLDTLLDEAETLSLFAFLSTRPQQDAAHVLGVVPSTLFREIERLVRNPPLFPSTESRHIFLTQTTIYINGIYRLDNKWTAFMGSLEEGERLMDRDKWERHHEIIHSRAEHSAPYIPWQDSTYLMFKDISEEEANQAAKADIELPICQRVFHQALLHILEHWRRDNILHLEGLEDLTKDSDIVDTQRAVDDQMYPLRESENGVVTVVQPVQPWGILHNPLLPFAVFPVQTSLRRPNLTAHTLLLCNMPEGYGTASRNSTGLQVIRVTTFMKMQAYRSNQAEDWSADDI